MGLASVIGGVLVNGYIDGYDSVFRRRLEYFGEIILLTMIYSMMCFTPFVDIYARMIVGYVIILIVSINISFYLVLMTYETFKDIRMKIRIKWYWYKTKKAKKHHKKS